MNILLIFIGFSLLIVVYMMMYKLSRKEKTSDIEGGVHVLFGIFLFCLWLVMAVNFLKE